MAQRIITTLLDDTDTSGQTEADETVAFALDGESYEIDLSAGNAEALRKALAPYAEVARRASAPGPNTSQGRRGRAGRRASSTGARANGSGVMDARTWAKSQGIEVNERGRVPAHIVKRFEDYQRAMSEDGPAASQSASDTTEAAPDAPAAPAARFVHPEASSPEASSPNGDAGAQAATGARTRKARAAQESPESASGSAPGKTRTTRKTAKA